MGQSAILRSAMEKSLFDTQRCNAPRINSLPKRLIRARPIFKGAVCAPRPCAPLEDERAGVIGDHAHKQSERRACSDPRGPRISCQLTHQFLSIFCQISAKSSYIFASKIQESKCKKSTQYSIFQHFSKFTRFYKIL